jgi:RNA-directed DNA polymerase
MHYAFDAWLAREFPTVEFERFADDAVVHCVTERQARAVLAAIADRMEKVGLRLHPDKTKIVYCRDGQRRGDHEHTSFTFLGFTFRPRGARDRHGRMFLAFLPAISKNALRKISGEGPPMAAAPPGQPHLHRPRQSDQPARGGLDAVLRPVLPVAAVSPPGAHQRLPGALDALQVQAATGIEQGPPQTAGDHRTVSPHVRALEVGHLRLAISMTGAV